MARSFLLTTLLIASSCSVYKSAVRDEFENRAPSRLVAAQATELGDCQTLRPFAAWIEKEFPGAPFEVLLSEQDLEVWQKQDPQTGTVEIRSFRLTAKGNTQICSKTFASEVDWQLEMPNYFEQLDQIPLD